MDGLTETLRRIRTSSATFGRHLFEPPWSIRFEHPGALTLVAMARGRGWVLPDDEPAVMLGERELALVRGGAAFVVASDKDLETPPFYVVGASGTCRGVDGLPLNASEGTFGARTCGNSIHGPSVLLTAASESASFPPGLLLADLPRVLHVPGRGPRASLVGILEPEIPSEEPGQDAVLDRVMDLVLAGVLRDWLSDGSLSARLRRQSAVDPIVRVGLRAIHDHPARPWTIATLAARSGVSRATFARRFTTATGDSPIAYLGKRRLAVAAELLLRGDETLHAIARQVGYSTPYALSAAFTREFGMRPTDYRTSFGR